MRPHHLLARALDIAQGLAHLRGDVPELLDWEADALRKGRMLLAQCGSAGCIVARDLLRLPLNPGKLPLLALERRGQLGDAIRVQAHEPDLAGGAGGGGRAVGRDPAASDYGRETVPPSALG
jgi:hypothetical protein